MVFFSAFGNAISSGFDTLSKGFSDVCDTVSSIGKSVADFAHSIKPHLGPILMTIAQIAPHPMVKSIAVFANTLLNILSIFHTNENVENMGDRALHAAEEGITTEKFDNFEDYIDALRNFKLNPDSSEKYSPSEKLIAGLGLAATAIADKFNTEPGTFKDLLLLHITNSEYFTPDRIKGLLENGKLIGDVSAYLEKHLSGEEASEFRSNLEITPEGTPMSDTELSELYSALNSARAEWTELNKQLNGND